MPRQRAVFVIGEIETDVPVTPRTISEHIASKLVELEPGTSFAVAGVSLATVRRVMREWLAGWQPAAADDGSDDISDEKPDLRADTDPKDAQRVRVWRR